MDYRLDLARFWEVNKRCLDLTKDIPRVPVDIVLTGDWICDLLGLDFSLYYSDYRYQQENRLRCSKIVKRELGCSILPAIDFGVVMDASIYGGRVNYEPNATPTLEPVVNDPSEIDRLVKRMQSADILDAGLVPKHLEWGQNIRRDFRLHVSYGGDLKGCATMLGQICGITNFLTWILTDPGQIRKLVDCWLETSVRYVDALRKATGYPDGMRGFSLASDVAGMLSPQLYREFIMEAELALYNRYAPRPGDKRYYHADYHMLQHLDTFREMGINQVNIDPYIEPKDILEKLPEAIIFGQIPPTEVLLYGNPEDVIACVQRDLQQAGYDKHLVVSTAGSINPGTSFENLRAICYAVDTYGWIEHGGSR